MAVTIKSRSITFTAAADAYAPVVHLAQLSFKTSTGVAGEALTITDAAGDTIVSYVCEGANDNAEFLFTDGYSCRGLTISAMPTGGNVIALLR
jgi:hypothetical protein